MKFRILQQDLIPTLSAVARSCGVRSQLPVLGNILLQTEKGKLKISSTNLEIGIVKTIKAEILEEGEISLPAKTLVEVVANLGGEKLDFSSGADQMEIKTSNFSSSISGIPATEFPTIPLGGKEVVSLDPRVLIGSLPQVVFAASSDESRPALVGILTEIKEKKLQLVATDGYRLAHKIIPVSENINFKALVPRRTFEELVRIISEEEVDGVQISLSEDKNQIIFRLGETQLSSRLIEGQFPAWEKIIPTQTLARVIIGREEFLKAVKLAAVFTRTEANWVKLQNSPKSLILTSEAKELGSQKNEVEASGEGEEIQIAFNTRFLQDILSALSSSQVIMEFSGSLSATTLKPIEEEGLEYIIMPVNLS